jgi:hypothetical protein
VTLATKQEHAWVVREVLPGCIPREEMEEFAEQRSRGLALAAATRISIIIFLTDSEFFATILCDINRSISGLLLMVSSILVAWMA